MQALIFDLDDTLLNSKKRIGEKTKRALFDCHNAGFQLIIATSRPIRAVRHFVEKEILDLCISVTLNGCVVYKAKKKSTAQIIGRLGSGAAALLKSINALDKKLHISIEFDGTQFATNQILSDRELEEYHSATRDMVISLNQLDAEKISKVAVDGLGVVLDDCLALCRYYPDLSFIPAVNHTFVNIVPAGVDKATALKIIAKEKGIDLSGSFAFGDDLPDLGMFRVVGTSVAMQNGKEQVKRAAHHIIGHCDDDAIGSFLYEKVLHVFND
ncbi:MAG: HAD-IIB family hydrolase [Bdellovibrionales bacterium]